MDSALYWRLSGFYLFYFAALGALMPYWPSYLRSLGFSSVDIGELMATIMSTRIVAPFIWGWLADRDGRRMRIVRGGSLLGVICFSGVFFGHSYAWLAVTLAAFSFFWNATLPQFEANTLAHLGDKAHSYSRIRLWGSIGFILAVVGLGKLLETAPVSLVPQVMLGLYVGIWLTSLSVPEHAVEYAPQGHPPLLRVLRRREVLALLGVCLLMQVSHGPYYTFYTIYLESHGYARSTAGYLWASGVLAEILVFLIMHRLLRRYALRHLLLLSLGLASLRWLLIGHGADFPPALLGAQTLHAASFAVFHASAIQLVHQYFPGRLLGRGQAIYSSVAFGVGGALGALGSGYTWSALGPATSYTLASLLCALALWISWRWLEPRPAPDGL